MPNRNGASLYVYWLDAQPHALAGRNAAKSNRGNATRDRQTVDPRRRDYAKKLRPWLSSCGASTGTATGLLPEAKATTHPDGRRQPHSSRSDLRRAERKCRINIPMKIARVRMGTRGGGTSGLAAARHLSITHMTLGESSRRTMSFEM